MSCFSTGFLKDQLIEDVQWLQALIANMNTISRKGPLERSSLEILRTVSEHIRVSVRTVLKCKAKCHARKFLIPVRHSAKHKNPEPLHGMTRQLKLYWRSVEDALDVHQGRNSHIIKTASLYQWRQEASERFKMDAVDALKTWYT